MHPNEQVLRDLDDAQMRGDVEGFMGYFADDVVVHVPGKSSLAGEYRGKDEFVRTFQQMMERAPDYSFQPHAYFADDEHGVSLQRSHYRRGDESVDVNEVYIGHFRDGKMAEIWMFTDNQDALDTFIG